MSESKPRDLGGESDELLFGARSRPALSDALPVVPRPPRDDFGRVNNNNYLDSVPRTPMYRRLVAASHWGRDNYAQRDRFRAEEAGRYRESCERAIQEAGAAKQRAFDAQTAATELRRAAQKDYAEAKRLRVEAEEDALKGSAILQELRVHRARDQADRREYWRGCGMQQAAYAREYERLTVLQATARSNAAGSALSVSTATTVISDDSPVASAPAVPKGVEPSGGDAALVSGIFGVADALELRQLVRQLRICSGRYIEEEVPRDTGNQ